MISKNLKVFEIDGRAYQFNIDGFRLEFARKAAKNNCRIGEYEQMLADSLFVSKDSVHNWRQKLNGPGDMDKIKKIAEFLGCDMMSLMTDVTEENTNEETNEMSATTKITLTDRQRDAVKRVYLEMLKVGDDLISDFHSDNNKSFVMVGFNIAKVLNEEFIDIPFELWNELMLFYWEHINDLRRWKSIYEDVKHDCFATYISESTDIDLYDSQAVNESIDNLDYNDAEYIKRDFLSDMIKTYEDTLRRTILPYL